jgi:hypothetical protein
LINQDPATTARVRPPRWSRKRRWFFFLSLILLLVGAGLILSAPRIATWYLRSKIIPKASRLLKREISVESVEVGWGRVKLKKIVVRSDRDGNKPMFSASLVRVQFRLRPLVRGRLVVNTVDVMDAQIELIRHADGRDNLRDLLKRGTDRTSRRSGKLKIGRIDLHSASVLVTDKLRHGELSAARVDGLFVPGAESRVTFHEVKIKSMELPSQVTWQTVEVVARLGRSVDRLPLVHLRGGRFRILPTLELSGVRGTISPKAKGQRFDVDVQGSYAGADTTLWSAKGWIEPFAMKGEILAKATRFELARIAKYFDQTPVIYPERTAIEGHLKLQLNAKILRFSGLLSVARLSIFHPGFAHTAIEDLSGEVSLQGRIETSSELAVHLDSLSVKYQGVEAKLTGQVNKLLTNPVISLRLEIPKVPCQAVLNALPPALVPRLRGFRLKGNFQADIRTHIDYSDLKSLKLGGKMPVDRCKVTYAPPSVSAERLLAPFQHEVEHRPGETLSFLIGPEEEDFAMYNEIPAHVVNAFLTTEDGAFFRHRGFIVSQFRAALARNLGKGGFRLGASTISMQMVKNVLLTHERTLARKLQELFLVWYLERILPKDRIMEIYLNAIEFGPSLYGIGRAAKHYFGKSVSDITPLEAAFFGTMLPSPKRRYVQYCENKMIPKWERKMRRILKRMVRRNRLTKEEYEPFVDAPLVFSRDFEAESVSECMRRIAELLESWDNERFRRLQFLVGRYAPHQAERYLHRPNKTKKHRRKRRPRRK